jgi:hypothetical protein
MGNSWLRGRLRRLRLCLRLRGADPAFHLFSRGRSSDARERSLVRLTASLAMPYQRLCRLCRCSRLRRRRFESGRPRFVVALMVAVV